MTALGIESISASSVSIITKELDKRFANLSQSQ
jgi:hypothetical protein